MLPLVQESLPGLRDIPGVQGSFVVSDGGAVAGRDLTRLVDDGLLAEVAPRLARLHETLSAAGDFLETCTFLFAEHRLYVKRLPGGFLGALLAPAVNLPALRMAANLVARRIGGQLAELSAAPPLRRGVAEPATSSGAVEVAPASRGGASSAGARATGSGVTVTGTPGQATLPELPSTARAVPRGAAGAPGPGGRPVRIYRGAIQR